MVYLLKDESLVGWWENFFMEYCKAEIENVALEYPQQRSLLMDYWKIDKVDQEMAETLLMNPFKVFFNAEEALNTIDVAIDKEMKLHFRVHNLPETQRILIRKLRAEHLGRFIAVEGLVKKVTEVRPKLKKAVFICQKCGAHITVEQDEDILKEPLECYEEQGGCGRSSTFKLSPSLSEFIDSQKVEIQESPEGLRGGAQPERISVYIDDDIVGNIAPGDRVIVNGVLVSQQRRRGSYRLTSFDKIM
ncbi:MAG TPA: minichromosome maintenance protein MCM, partial [Thermoplasmata archaeon]|nr:minichromosome maintenance protein MCM [Thermoplasmata archaeon]